MLIGAFDIATTTGWAIGTPDGAPACGSFKLPPTGRDYGQAGKLFLRWLEGMIEQNPFDMVVYEMPVLPNETQIETLIKLYGLAFAFETRIAQWNESHERKIICRATDMQVVRSHFIGVTRAPKEIPKNERRKWIKRKVMDRCLELGWHPANDDEGDALSILSYALSVKSPEYAIAQTPLFTGRPAL